MHVAELARRPHARTASGLYVPRDAGRLVVPTQVGGYECAGPMPLPKGLALFPRDVQDDADGPPSPPNVTNLFAFVWYNLGRTDQAGISGTGEAVSPITPPQSLLEKTGQNFSAASNQFLTLADWSTPGNNGTFPVRTIPTTGQLQYQNPNTVLEGSVTATWRSQGKCTAIVDQKNGRSFASGSLALRDNLIPGKTLLGGIGWGVNNNTYSNAAVGTAYNGNVDSSWSWQQYSPDDVGTYSMQVVNGGNLHWTNVLASSSQIVMQRAASSATTNYTITAASSPQTGFVTYGIKYVASANRCYGYINGAYVGQSGTGTARSMSVTTIMKIGGITSRTDSKGIYWKGFATAPAAWSDAEFLAVHKSFQAYDAYYG